MYAFIAPVVAQSASTKPTIVSTMPVDGFLSSCFKLWSSSSVAWLGMTPCR